ncbi:uncharacterized protein LOC121406570 [Lytechinus variegatus]|uniref:uncharacterized protein LOC121406570 n=1 Tax=Lytechinus variegatus TaxID=7654 RepID=UPI001BB128AA|nr:uncharacterized protein LOC121406570 [Lytechinus variegatus]
MYCDGLPSECFCGNIATSDPSTLTGPSGYFTNCPCPTNTTSSCNEVADLSVFDLLPGNEDPDPAAGPQPTENSTTVITSSPKSVTQQSTTYYDNPVKPVVVAKTGTSAGVLGTICGLLFIYGIVVSSLLYLSRRRLQSLKNSKEQKPYSCLNRETRDQRDSYQGMYLSPNQENDPNRNSSVLEHSYQGVNDLSRSNQDVVPHSHPERLPARSYAELVNQVHNRQARQETTITAQVELDDHNYIVPDV